MFGVDLEPKRIIFLLTERLNFLNYIELFVLSIVVKIDKVL